MAEALRRVPAVSLLRNLEHQFLRRLLLHGSQCYVSIASGVHCVRGSLRRRSYGVGIIGAPQDTGLDTLHVRIAIRIDRVEQGNFGDHKQQDILRAREMASEFQEGTI